MVICTYNYKLIVNLDICRYMNEWIKFLCGANWVHKAMYAFCFYLLPFNLMIWCNQFQNNYSGQFLDNTVTPTHMTIYRCQECYFLWLFCKITCGTDRLLRRLKICSGCSFSNGTNVWRTHSHWQKCQMKLNPSSSHSSPIILIKPPIVSHNCQINLP